MTKKDKKIVVHGWQAMSIAHGHPLIDDIYTFSPFGQDNVEIDKTKTHLKPPATGWCSYYAFGAKINQKNILANARWIAEHKNLGLEYVIIDDGWCEWGDWQNVKTKGFPQGLKFVADEIKKLGLKPGLWMAPFAADTTSQLFKNHPGWFLKDDQSSFVFAHNCQVWMPSFICHHALLLDYKNPEVKKYFYDSIDKILGEWGFEMIKLDFIASVYFDPKLKSPELPNQALKDLLLYIRKNYPHVYILGGCAPLAPLIGLADAIRISNDIIKPELDSKWPLNKFINSGRLNQLEQNLTRRKNLAEVINLDPDVFVCRTATGFSETQIKRLATIIKETPRGLKFLGDDLPNLQENRVQKYIFPLFT